MNCLKSISIAAVVFASAAVSSHAALIPVTGGDFGEGFNAPSVDMVVWAVNFNGNGPVVTIQGVTFTPHTGSETGFSVSGTGAWNATPSTLTSPTTTNDQEMQELYSENYYVNPNLLITFSGLTPDTVYRLDVFAGSNDTRVGDFYLNGVLIHDDFSTTDQAINIQNFVTSSETGVITAQINNVSNNPFIYGVMLANVPETIIPEPTSLALLAAGGLALMRRRRMA